MKTNNHKLNMTASDKMEELTLEGARFAYYCLAKNWMSDYEYDKRERHIIEQGSTLFDLAGSDKPESYRPAARALARVMLGHYDRRRFKSVKGIK
jgi:hypothetical protein